MDAPSFEPDRIPIGLYCTTSGGVILEVNEAFVELLGYPDRKALLRVNAADLYMDAGDRLQLKELAAQRGTLRNHEVRLRRHDGRPIWVELSLSATPSTNGQVIYEGALVDVTERKLAEEALWESEQRMRFMLEQMPAVLWAVDADMRFSLSLGAGLQGLGLRPHEVVGMSLQEFAGSSDPEHPILAAHRRGLQGESVAFEHAFEGRLYECHVQPWRDLEGRAVGVLGVALDVSDRQRSREALERNVSLLRSTLESTADGILVTDAAGAVLLFNRRFLQMWGLPGEALENADAQALAARVAPQLADPEAFLAGARALYDDLTREALDVLHLKDGRVIERYSLPHLLDGRAVGRVCSFRYAGKPETPRAS